MYDVIHVDGKRFYLYKVLSSFILAEDEEAPHLTCPSKRFTTKVMFFAAAGRPRYNHSKKRGFDETIGIFPIIKKREAKRTTKTKRKETTSPFNCLSTSKCTMTCSRRISCQSYKLVGPVCSIIRLSVLRFLTCCCLSRGTKSIYIQQDNASLYVTGNHCRWAS
jgi:hypothetical protein